MFRSRNFVHRSHGKSFLSSVISWCKFTTSIEQFRVLWASKASLDIGSRDICLAPFTVSKSSIIIYHYCSFNCETELSSTTEEESFNFESIYIKRRYGLKSLQRRFWCILRNGAAFILFLPTQPWQLPQPTLDWIRTLVHKNQNR